ncbi:sulfotransferase 6B1 [Anolis carolinensis]|uniref:Sulfotransferase n=1 Tax=Anolis carolinensis TaxID=28377 RepID=G1KBP7_ANOCA|nr:PREDICTED: sulfotransferase 6B1 [Anolis carolinensis]|eukprot:XP_003215876.1 PREDICTED: sulfotransferase 6B1 [Anolis carolinensis]
MAKDRKHVVEFLDRALEDGSKLSPEEKLCSYKGILFPITICHPETLQALETFEARKDDVIMTGYPKCGSHWLGQILNNMSVIAAKYTEEEKTKRAELEKELDITPRLEFGDPSKFKRMENLPSRRIIITHLDPNILPKSAFKNKAKILVLIRNPKDTLVSFFHFNNKMSIFPTKTWDDFFTDFMNGKVSWGSYFDFVKEWDKYIDDENVTSLCYEELKENPNLEVKRIATFLGFPLTEKEIQSIVEKSSFKTMKQSGQETLGAFGDLLFRKGSVGDWKTLFSESQNKEMDRKFEEHLAGTKLGARIKYDIYCKT